MTEQDRTDGEAVNDADRAGIDDAFEALADADRRVVLYYLRERGESSLSELADVVAGRRAAAEGTFVRPERRDRIEIDLHHAALPALADSGAVDYDPETGRVALADPPAAVEALIDTAIAAAGDADHASLDGEHAGGQ
ncbi:DUF7344 domain-containing protein [Halostella litorea]|uniref:DUF7344 domain-containing protein n=1 Tax=Halostella litorea TaxID=2528831 RepID=UPI0010932133|nr:hypothetical protein [Halostella litorea]